MEEEMNMPKVQKPIFRQIGEFDSREWQHRPPRKVHSRKIMRKKIVNNNVCKFCDEPIKWGMTRINNYYKWTPFNPDKSKHVWTCKNL